MIDRPEFFRYAPAYGTVLHVYPRSWEVDVLAANGGIIPRAVVLGSRLPEESTKGRPQWVVILWSEATEGQAYALPIPSRLPGGRYDRADLVYLEEVQGFRITIRAPGNQGRVVAGQTGEFEVCSEKDGRRLQARIIEAGGVIRLDTPKTRIVLADDEEAISVEAVGNVAVDAGGDIEAMAGGDVTVQAGGSIKLTAAGTVEITGASVKITGPGGIDLN